MSVKRCLAMRACAVAALACTLAHAAPIPRSELVALCNDAEDQAQCGRLVEARQLRTLSRIAERDGDELRVTLAPAGLSVFRDVVNVHGARTYAVWDYLESLDTLVLFTTVGDRTGFMLVQRRTGDEYRIAAEPVLSPDGRRFVTADFCARECDNEVALWRIARDGITKDATWAPAAPWSDVSVSWRGDASLVLEYVLPGEPQPRIIERRLDDPSWKKVRGK